ncbi:uncharacterized protein PAC_17128 [Phialocephala subalpina]|uniref:Uncharacterized protein n=1 Tax=Phialocephala subalpina TaxID=576137 RepID=A0A1L7XQC7_9HELO|nr:uncharacterized protein PAC_17128 [Phialocephala subalpina]
MTGYKRVFLGCWVSLDEQDRLCEVSLDSSTVEEVSGPSDQQIDSIFQAFEIRREGDVPSNPIIILEDTPSVTVAADTNTPPQSPPQRPEKRPRPDSYAGMMTRSSSRTKKSSSPRRRGGSRQNSSQEKIDSLSVSDDPDQSTSRGTSGQSHTFRVSLFSFLLSSAKSFLEYVPYKVEVNPQGVVPGIHPNKSCLESKMMVV